MTKNSDTNRDDLMKEQKLFLNSGKCAWGRCIFCGWGKLEGRKKTIHELKEWIDSEIQKVDRLKIFNSGSFFDDEQVPKAFRSYVVKKCEQIGIKELIVESRENFITEDSIKDMKNDRVKVFVAIGLEVGDDEALKKLNKGKTVDDYINACKILRENGFGIRSYVLVNAPYTNDKSLDKTVKLANEYSDEIVLINLFPHAKAPMFDMWLNGEWKALDKKDFEKIKTKYKSNKKIEFDFDNFSFVPRFPMNRQILIKGATIENLKHPNFEVWQDYISRFYEVSEGKDVVLFLPCSFKKPYNFSQLHKAILSVLQKSKIWDRLHLIVLSTPGVIPYEFASHYPFNRYDWPEWEETPEVMKEYVKVTKKRITNYLKNHSYKKYYCYLKYSETYEALKEACEKLGIEIVNILKKETYEKVKIEKNPLSLEEALKDLKEFTS